TIILGSSGNCAPVHPSPTHYAVARANFRGGKTMIFRTLPLEEPVLKKFVTVGEAIGDLPRIKMGGGGEIVPYDRPPHSDYARKMRSADTVTYNHFGGILSPQNVERMKYV